MTTELLNTVSSSFNTVSGYALSALNVVLPIALGIFAILFVWIIAKKFFMKLTGNKSSKVEKEIDDDDDDYEGFDDDGDD